MGTLATQETDLPLGPWLDRLQPKYRRGEVEILLKIFERLSGAAPKVWGDYFIIGFGSYSYTRKGSKELYQWFKVGFAPRKDKLTLYLTSDLNRYEEVLANLGSFKKGSGCLYIKRLSDINLNVLETLILETLNEHEKTN